MPRNSAHCSGVINDANDRGGLLKSSCLCSIGTIFLVPMFSYCRTSPHCMVLTEPLPSRRISNSSLFPSLHTPTIDQACANGAPVPRSVVAFRLFPFEPAIHLRGRWCWIWTRLNAYDPYEMNPGNTFERTGDVKIRKPHASRAGGRCKTLHGMYFTTART